VEKLELVPLAGDPPVAVQANVYGEVPPVADAVQATGVPTVPVVGQLIETARAKGEIVTDAVAVAVFALESVVTTEIVYDPLTL